MKTTLALLSLVLSLALTLNTTAQEVAGSWQVQSVGNQEPPKGASLALAFGEENRATITYNLSGTSQAWQYTYTVADGQLTLEPAKPFGEPNPVTYDIKFDEGKLLLLTPKPDPVEEETDDVDSERESDADAVEEEAEEEVEEEDTRVPVWVLIKA